MIYQGSCHCGKVAYEVEGELKGVVACNCSICRRKASLYWFLPRAQLKLTTDPAAYSTYQFNKHVIEHHFCSTCGIHAFGEGVGPDGSTMAAVNVNCLEGVDLAALPVEHFDGRSL